MTKFATPKYEIEEAENADVYPPSEDTFLFMDALEKEREQIIGLRPSITVEIGSGSGVITVFLRQLLATSSSAGNIFSICTDLNERALKCTRRTAELNSMESGCMELVRCNIMDPLISRLADTVDLLLLNPPYVPTEESAKNEEECCYAGGAQGRDLLNQLLPHVAKILSPKGLFYLVALKENGVDELISSEISRKYGLKGSIVLERRCRNEYLHVLKFTRCNTENDGSGPSSTSCTSPATASKEEVPPSTSTQTQASSSTFTNDKVMILLKPVGEAKQLKKEYSRIKVDKNCTIFLLGQRIRRMLDMQATDSLYLFVKEAFAPSPDHTVKALQQCFGSDNGMLLIQYSTLPAWG